MKKLLLCFSLILLITGCKFIQNENSNYSNIDSNDIVETNSIINYQSEMSSTIIESIDNEWFLETKEDKFVITVIGSSKCSHCLALKPIIEKVSKKYKLKLYFFYIDEIKDEKEKEIIINSYDTNYKNAVPHMFITKNGKVITNMSGELSEEELVEFLKLNLVIK